MDLFVVKLGTDKESQVEGGLGSHVASRKEGAEMCL